MKSLQIYQLADLPSSLFLMTLHLDYGINSLMTDCWLLVSPRRDKPKLSRPTPWRKTQMTIAHRTALA